MCQATMCVGNLLTLTDVGSVMSEAPIDNINVIAQEPLPTPAEIKARLPLSDKARETVEAGRKTVEAILEGKDPRLLVVIGPCSVHDTEAAIDYAKRLKVLHDELGDSLYIVMRVYFEKPRTTVGWKGLINDPYMNDSFDIEEGIARARQLLLALAEMGLPAGTEALDPITPQYLGDLISWTAIGARTTESQTHREMASGLSTAVGFKNGTDGNLEVAINALRSASSPHSFLGILSRKAAQRLSELQAISMVIWCCGVGVSRIMTPSVLPCLKRRWKTPDSQQS